MARTSAALTALRPDRKLVTGTIATSASTVAGGAGSGLSTSGDAATDAPGSAGPWLAGGVASTVDGVVAPGDAGVAMAPVDEPPPTRPPPKPSPMTATRASTATGISHRGRPRPRAGGVWRGLYWGSRTVTGRTIPEGAGGCALRTDATLEAGIPGMENAPSGRADGA